jgi:hypothetical protein
MFQLILFLKYEFCQKDKSLKQCHWENDSISDNQKIIHFSRSLDIRKSLSLVPVLSRTNPVQNLMTYFYNIRSNIILPWVGECRSSIFSKPKDFSITILII